MAWARRLCAARKLIGDLRGSGVHDDVFVHASMGDGVQLEADARRLA